MRLSTSWLLPAFITTASAATDASVYLIQQDPIPSTSTPPTLSPEQARLVLAQRLGVSKFHSLKDASDSTLSYINRFGRQRQALFDDEEDLGRDSKHVVVMVDEASAEDMQTVSKAIDRETLFYVSSSPSAKTNVKLADDISKQIGQAEQCSLENPYIGRCWRSHSSSIHYYDISKSSKGVDAIATVLKKYVLGHHVGYDSVNVLVVLLPASPSSTTTYGSYDMPNVAVKRRQFEEPIAFDPPSNQEKTVRISAAASNSSKPIHGVLPSCFATLDVCNERTNNCSGHGKCYKKRGNPSGGQACFACGCSASNQTFTHGAKGSERKGVKLIYWGGAACQKEDVSGPFWLLAIFSIVGVGLITWAIGLMYSVGEEKLPGVIGAGVSNNRAR